MFDAHAGHKGISSKIRRLKWPLLVLALSIALVPALLQRGKLKAQAPTYDLALVLAIDCSYSVDASEYRLQMDGLAHAFRSLPVLHAITSGNSGRIIVSVMQWSDEANQVLAVPWTEISSAASADAFAATVQRTPRRLAEGGTAIGAAIQFAGAVLRASPFAAQRKVIDISSDGRNNRGPEPLLIQSRLGDKTITVNGLAILNEWPTLDRYFEQRVVGGPFNFVITANTYDAYAEAIYRKLLLEITGPGIS